MKQKLKCVCGYEWTPRVETPIECPECKRRLSKQKNGRVNPRT